MRVYLDANILFSAARNDGAVCRLLVLLGEAGHSCHADAFVVEEARRNLAAKVPARLGALQRVLDRVELAPGPARAGDELDAVPLPGKDRPVLAAAIELRCNVLMTGDRTHFGPLFGTEIGGVEILSPAALGRRLLGS